MKNLSTIFMLFMSFFIYGQLNENFSDGNFTHNPVWSGSSSNFFVNPSLQLQSKATTASVSTLFTPSEAFVDAVWQCWVKIAFTPSINNYSIVYLTSDRLDLTSGFYGYYVQIGGTNKEVSLYVQEGAKKTKIIDGVDKRVELNPLEIIIKVTRSSQGSFELFSKLPSESAFVSEGVAVNNAVAESKYFGLLFSNTSTTGSAYFFDDIVVTGKKALDSIAPIWNSFLLEKPNIMKLGFSEKMDFSKATFEVDRQVGNPASLVISQDKTTITLFFDHHFETGKVYKLQTQGLTDLSGNRLVETSRETGIYEKIEFGDLIINEVMFENPELSEEYLEIFNRSEKLLDISGLRLCTKKNDGTFSQVAVVPYQTLFLPKTCLAFCPDSEKVRNYHNCPQGSNVVTTDWSSLNNESSTLVLTNKLKDSIYDELTYNVKWHHVLVKNPKGVALERVNPALSTQDKNSWHSASTIQNYGTPGYLNSQFREMTPGIDIPKIVWIEPEAFSPDNDGVDDICFVRYKFDTGGFVANAIVFNAAGLKVYQLASNILLSTDGFIAWDGRTNSGKNADVGIYVLYIEMYNPEAGLKIQKKLPIVVSSR